MSDEFKYNPLTNDMDLVGGNTSSPGQATEGNIPQFGSNPDELEDSGIASDDILVKHYGVCSTAADVAEKTVTVEPAEFRSLTGDRVVVRFEHANTASNPTLAVGNLPAKAIYANGVAITDGNSKTLLMGVCEFIFDGQEWNLMGNHINTIADVSPVIDAALNNLNGEIAATDPEEVGDVHCKSIDMDSLLKVCGYPLYIIVTKAPDRAPDFIGQFWIDRSAGNIYMAKAVSNSASFIRINN